jgi:hypothetical protein
MSDTAKLPTAPTLYEFEFHALAARFDLIEGEEYDALIDSIERQGLLHPITIYQGKILDGRNRYRAAKAARYNFTARDFVELRAGADPNDFVINTNVQRRHLNTDQKKELVIQLMRERPDASDRQIAKLTGVDPKTVGNHRRALEERSTEFAKAWRGLDKVQRREFVTAYRDELRQASY